MRRIISVAAVLAAMAVLPFSAVLAKGPGGGGLHIGVGPGGVYGGVGGGYYGGYGNGGWGYGSNWSGYPRYGYGSYPGYGYGGYRYGSYYTPYQGSVVVNPPVQAFSGEPIRITNPADNKAALSYTLNGQQFTIQPGQSQDLQSDRAWVIEFNRGSNRGDARYGLEPGQYSFSGTENGWELYQGVLQQGPATASQPSVPAPPSMTQQNPSNPPATR